MPRPASIMPIPRTMWSAPAPEHRRTPTILALAIMPAVRLLPAVHHVLVVRVVLLGLFGLVRVGDQALCVEWLERFAGLG